MPNAWFDDRPDLARLDRFLTELIERAGLAARFRPADLTTRGSAVGVIACDGYELEISYLDKVPIEFTAWWRLDFPRPDGQSLQWTGLPIVGWRKPRSAIREASLVASCRILARLPDGIKELTAAAESAMVKDGTSWCEYGNAVTLCLGGRALLGLDVGQAWVNSLIDTVVERNEQRNEQSLTDDWLLTEDTSLRMAVAQGIYGPHADVQVVMNWDPAERPAHPMRRPSLAALRHGFAQQPPRVSIDLGPRASLTATLTDEDVTFTLTQDWFDWEVLPFPTAPVSVPRPSGDTGEVADTIRQWMSQQGFYDLSRHAIEAAQGQPDGEAIAWNWSVMCTAIEGARRGILSIRQQDDVCEALVTLEQTTWPAVTTAVTSVAAAFREV